MTTGERIKTLIDEQGIKQRDLADKIGVTEVSVSRYVHDQRTPKAPVIAKIARELHTTIDFLLGQEEEDADGGSYDKAMRDIKKHAHAWSCIQKQRLVYTLFEV